MFGWTGLESNYRQLLTVREPIMRALERTGARLLLNLERAATAGARCRRGWSFGPGGPQTEVADLGEIDVGLMPLPDTPYARGKCAYKLIQYMALGRPGVASPVGANCEVVTPATDGFLPASDGEWEETLVSLALEPDLRRRVGEAGRKRVEEAYALAAVVPRCLDVLKRVAGWTAGTVR